MESASAGCSQTAEQLSHRGIQSSRDHLQRDDADFALAQFNVRDVASVQVQMHGEVGLRPALLHPQRSDAPAKLNQERMSAAGHAPIVPILFLARVWYARHSGLDERNRYS